MLDADGGDAPLAGLVVMAADVAVMLALALTFVPGGVHLPYRLGEPHYLHAVGGRLADRVRDRRLRLRVRAYTWAMRIYMTACVSDVDVGVAQHAAFVHREIAAGKRLWKQEA